MTQQHDFDFCVCGNGMVGSVAALALAQLGYTVAWVAAEQVRPFCADDKPDLRMSAISLGSVKLLEQIGVWQPIEAMRVKPYTDLRVWEIDDNETLFSASEIGQSCLGYFVENRLIQLACAETAQSFLAITRYEQSVQQVISANDRAQVILADGATITCRYVIGAEGANSIVRKSAGIATKSWQYAQQAMGIIVEIDGEVGNETWQQFFPSGPRALLPMYDNFAALIWYDSAQHLQGLQTLSNSALMTAIEQAFPARLPKIKAIHGHSRFPLTRMHAQHYVKDATILVGDAAHTVNPLAGQGVNLGFGDVTALCDVLKSSGKKSLAFDYEVTHKQKNRVMMTALEVIYHSFKQPSTPMKWLRNLGLTAAQYSGPAKSHVIKFAAGLY